MGTQPYRDQGKGGRNNAQVNRTGFNDNWEEGMETTKVIIGIIIKRETMNFLLRMICLQT